MKKLSPKEWSLLWWLITSGCLMGGGVGMYFVILRMEPKDVWVRIAEILLTGLFLSGLALLLGETGLLSKFFHREIGRTFTERIFSQEYMKETFCKDKRRGIRNAAVESLCPDTLVKGPDGLLEVLDTHIYPMIERPMRYNLDVTYHQKVEEIGGKKIIKINHTYFSVYKNPFVKPIVDRLTFENVLDAISGINPEELLKIVKFKVNKRNITFPLEMTANTDGTYTFRGSVEIPIAEKVPVEIELQKIQPYTEHDYIAVWMPIPTRDMIFRYKHPGTFVSQHQFFGFGEEEDPKITAQPDYEVWSYKGWLLKKHGLLVYWVETQ